MRAVVPTIYGDATMAALRHGTDLNLNDNAFLNKAIKNINGIDGINEANTPSVPNELQVPTGETNLMKNKYFIIGTGAHDAAVRADGASYLRPVPHSSRHSGPYFWIPFKLIPVGQPDLTGVERQNYVMRRFITINGTTYIGYWIKRMPITDTAPVLTTYTITNGVKSAVGPLPGNTGDMTPTRPTLVNGQLPNSGRYFEAKLNVDIVLTAAEINDLRNVGTILFNDPDAVVISEIGLVYGIERTNFSFYALNNSGSTTVNNNPNIVELAAAHVGCWISLVKHTPADSDTTIDLNIGKTEPEFHIDQ